jgi:class 3 adenylate cyclase
VATRTRTVVFTDLANYTNAVQRADREALRNLIARHHELVTPTLVRYGGKVVKNLGDSFMALFPAATDAVRAGLDLVESIPEQGQFSIRVGIATGDVEEIDGDAFGDAVNLASRIIAKTPDAEVWLSAGTLICMNQSEIAWDRVGRHRLKGLPGEQEVFRAVPNNRAWLPDVLKTAIRSERLVRIAAGDPLPSLPPAPIILLEGFEPGSAALQNVVDRLPVVDPASLWLQVFTIAPADRFNWTNEGRAILVGRRESVDAAMLDESRPRRSSTGSDTIIFDLASTSMFEVAMLGLALPSVPMSEVVSSYSYDLLADGRWVNRHTSAIGRVQVDSDGVAFVPLQPGIVVGGRAGRTGTAVPLRSGDEIAAPHGMIRFEGIDGRGYAGMMLSSPTGRLGIAMGQRAEIGREPGYPGLALPDRRGQDNIRWCVGHRAARARQSGFTLDRALAGRRQCAIEPTDLGAELVPLHPRCPTYLYRNGSLQGVKTSASISAGDLVVVGTSVISLQEPEL